MTDTGQAEPVGGLSVAATATDGIRVVTVAGEIDHHTGDQLRDALDVTGTARPRIVIDLHQVTFLDSSGINILIAAYQDITAAGGWLRLAAPAPSVRHVLQLIGIDDIIDCRDTLHHALTPDQHPTPPPAILAGHARRPADARAVPGRPVPKARPHGPPAPSPLSSGQGRHGGA